MGDERTMTLRELRAKIQALADVPDETLVYLNVEGDTGTITAGLSGVSFTTEMERSPSGFWDARVHLDGDGDSGMDRWHATRGQSKEEP